MKLSATSFLFLAIAPALHAQALPQLSVKPWIAQYSGYQQRKFRFSVGLNGQGLLAPSGAKDDYLGDHLAIFFVPRIKETLPDGKVVERSATSEGWEAVTPAAANPEKVIYRGTVAGGARFEVNLEFDGTRIRAGGKVIEKGKSANPMAFVFDVKFPNVYAWDKDADKRAEKAKKDRIDLVRTDGKKLKLDVLTPLDAETAEFSGPGITQARIELAGYKGHRLEIASEPGGAFEFLNKNAGALYEGFTLAWKHDAAKDPEGKSRFVFEVR